MKILYFVVIMNLCLLYAVCYVNQSPITSNQLNSNQEIDQEIRFKESSSSLGDINSFILNTEVGELKSASNPSDEEQEVLPSYASATSFKKKSFLFFDFGSHPPENAISGHDGYWMSQDNSKEEALMMTFEIPTKIDIINIIWKIPPTSFIVEFNVEDNGNFIPLMNREIKYQPINERGERVSISKVSYENTLYFKKPVYAKNIRIKMWDPLKNKMFSVEKVKYFNVKSFIMLVNQTANPCANYCVYVNTDKPRVQTMVEAADCLSGLSTADNRELFELSFDRSIRSFNGRLCLGFDIETLNVQLYECQSPTQWVLLYNQDGSISFKGYEKMCMFLDKSNIFSDNFILREEDIEVSSTFEGESEMYKKGNILSKFKIICSEL